MDRQLRKKKFCRICGCYGYSISAGIVYLDTGGIYDNHSKKYLPVHFKLFMICIQVALHVSLKYR